MTSHRIDFIDKDNTGSMVLCLVEQVADTGSAHADKHLDEFTAADGEERHAGFAGNGFRQQRFTGAGRSDK